MRQGMTGKLVITATYRPGGGVRVTIETDGMGTPDVMGMLGAAAQNGVTSFVTQALEHLKATDKAVANLNSFRAGFRDVVGATPDNECGAGGMREVPDGPCN